MRRRATSTRSSSPARRARKTVLSRRGVADRSVDSKSGFALYAVTAKSTDPASNTCSIRRFDAALVRSALTLLQSGHRADTRGPTRDARLPRVEPAASSPSSRASPKRPIVREREPSHAENFAAHAWKRFVDVGWLSRTCLRDRARLEQNAHPDRVRVLHAIDIVDACAPLRRPARSCEPLRRSGSGRPARPPRVAKPYGNGGAEPGSLSRPQSGDQPSSTLRHRKHRARAPSHAMLRNEQRTSGSSTLSTSSANAARLSLRWVTNPNRNPRASCLSAMRTRSVGSVTTTDCSNSLKPPRWSPSSLSSAAVHISSPHLQASRSWVRVRAAWRATTRNSRERPLRVNQRARASKQRSKPILDGTHR